MGTSLRTLAKLTNPAMARWWKTRGNWLLGAGVGCGAVFMTQTLLSNINPRVIALHPSLSWIPHLASLLENALPLYFLLCAVLATNASCEACRQIGQEHAAPPVVIPAAQLYTLALLRSWPAYSCFAGLEFMMFLDYYYHGGSVFNAVVTSSQLISALNWSFDGTCAILNLSLWLIALQIVSPRQPRLIPAWVVVACGLPVLADATQSIINAAHCYRDSANYFGHLATNSYALECTVIGMALFGLVIQWQQRGRIGLSRTLFALLTGAAVLHGAALNLPGVIPDNLPYHIRLALENWAQLAFGFMQLPFRFHVNESYGFWSTTVTSDLIQGLRLDLPYWASLICFLLNLAWLAALYLFISRELLREPRQPDQPA